MFFRLRDWEVLGTKLQVLEVSWCQEDLGAASCLCSASSLRDPIYCLHKHYICCMNLGKHPGFAFLKASSQDVLFWLRHLWLLRTSSSLRGSWVTITSLMSSIRSCATENLNPPCYTKLTKQGTFILWPLTCSVVCLLENSIRLLHLTIFAP